MQLITFKQAWKQYWINLKERIGIKAQHYKCLLNWDLICHRFLIPIKWSSRKCYNTISVSTPISIRAPSTKTLTALSFWMGSWTNHLLRLTIISYKAYRNSEECLFNNLEITIDLELFTHSIWRCAMLEEPLTICLPMCSPNLLKPSIHTLPISKQSFKCLLTLASYCFLSSPLFYTSFMCK